MCVYCMVGDFTFPNDPPWKPQDEPLWPPQIPKPAIPPTHIIPWDLDKLEKYLDILKQIKALEDQLGCPCEPNKADYIGLIEKRIELLKKELKGAKKKIKEARKKHTRQSKGV